MTRKDYVTIATCFAEERMAMIADGTDPLTIHGGWLGLRAALIVELGIDNPRFDRDRFIKATTAGADIPSGYAG
jgi:hypothetical protein